MSERTAQQTVSSVASKPELKHPRGVVMTQPSMKPPSTVANSTRRKVCGLEEMKIEEMRINGGLK